MALARGTRIRCAALLSITSLAAQMLLLCIVFEACYNLKAACMRGMALLYSQGCLRSMPTPCRRTGQLIPGSS